MTAQITVIDPGADRARQARIILGRCVKNALENFGDSLAGFAIVTWDMQGAAHSSYFTDVGPVNRCLMPTYVHDALQRYVTKEQVEDCSTTLVTGD